MKTTLYIAMFFAMTLGAMSQIFYEVTDPAMPKSKVYLLGTIPVADSTFYPLDDKILDAFKSSEEMILDMLPEEQRELDTIFRETIYYRAGEDSLQNHISNAAFLRLAKYFEANGIPLYVLSHCTPAIIPIIIQQTEAMKAGYSLEMGIENYFLQNAGDKHLIGLQTARELNKLVDIQNHFDDVEVMLTSYVDDAESTNYIKYLRNLGAAWKAHDAKKLPC